MEVDREKLIAMSLEALSDFDAFCTEHGLEYALAFGTELGCVRHGGFIPWDDDVDVDMPIEDYVKLRKLWKTRGNHEKYFLQTKQNELFKPTLFYQLRRNGTCWIDPGCESYPIHWGIAIIDIFPVYHMPKTHVFQKLQKKFSAQATKHCWWSWNHRQASKFLHQIHRSLSMIHLNIVFMISALSKNSELLFYTDCDKTRNELKLTWMYPAKKVRFENMFYRGHADQDQYLKSQYDDYMILPPASEREGHPIGIIDLEKDYTEYVKKN